MAKERKRPVGRPATGRSPTILLTLDTDLLKRIERVARADFSPRAVVIREAIERGLPKLTPKKRG